MAGFWIVGMCTEKNHLYVIQSEEGPEHARKGAENVAASMGYTVDWNNCVGEGKVPRTGIQFDVFQMNRIVN